MLRRVVERLRKLGEQDVLFFFEGLDLPNGRQVNPEFIREYRERFVLGSRELVKSPIDLARLNVTAILSLDDSLVDVEPTSLDVQKISCRYISEKLRTKKFDFKYPIDDLWFLYVDDHRCLIQCRTGKLIAPAIFAGFLCRHIDVSVSVSDAVRYSKQIFGISVTEFMKSQLFEHYD